jgi:glycosyltransferase involved in cell wall biosynthesis
MSVGLPVVTTHISGIPELVKDGVNGLLIPPEDPTALAQAFIRLIEDNPLAVNLSRNAQDTIEEKFNGDKLAVHMANLFRKSVAS